jgi:hypothetical protein
MAPILATLIIAIVVIGLLHIIGGHYSDRVRDRKRWAAMIRLKGRELWHSGRIGWLPDYDYNQWVLQTTGAVLAAMDRRLRWVDRGPKRAGRSRKEWGAGDPVLPKWPHEKHRCGFPVRDREAQESILTLFVEDCDTDDSDSKLPIGG